MTASAKAVFTKDDFEVIRVEGYGFRCNSLSVSWEVHKGGHFFASFLRLKQAKQFVQHQFN